MSTNSDNAMARFLFAILRQKDLKDIDWNQVAKDPILTQPISNGHAARMRYSRFRSSMLGTEPQRRNRAAISKPKAASKSKKAASKLKLEDDEEEEEEEESIIKKEGSASQAKANKQETIQLSQDGNAMSISTMTNMFPDSRVHHYQTRMLTPCSDTDGNVAVHNGYSGSPASDMMHPDTPFSFAPSDSAWHAHSPTFSIGYDMGYTPGFAQHSPLQQNDLCVPPAILEPNPSSAAVKHEEWDIPFGHV